MKSANINRAVSGFGMALAAMGATQADAEIVSLSFGNSPLSINCFPNSDCAAINSMSLLWSGGGLARFGISLSEQYGTELLGPGSDFAGVAFKALNDQVNGTVGLASGADFLGIVGDRYVGFNTLDNLNGWLKVTFGGDLDSMRTITFVEGAIETTAGTAITVGDTGLTPVPVPPMLPAMGLAVLALGAAGVRRARKAA